MVLVAAATALLAATSALQAPHLQTLRPRAPLARSRQPRADLPVIGGLLEGGSKLLGSEEAKQLGVYFAQTLISWGVPASVGHELM